MTGQHGRNLFGRGFFIFADVMEGSGRRWQRLVVVVYLFKNEEIYTSFGILPLSLFWAGGVKVVKSPFLD